MHRTAGPAPHHAIGVNIGLRFVIREPFLYAVASSRAREDYASHSKALARLLGPALIYQQAVRARRLSRIVFIGDFMFRSAGAVCGGERHLTQRFGAQPIQHSEPTSRPSGAKRACFQGRG